MRRSFPVALAVTLALVLAAPALAQMEGGGTTTTTATPELISESGAVEPAVPAPPPEKPDTEQPWTARFIIPTVVAVSILLILGLIWYYVFRIANRYRVVRS